MGAMPRGVHALGCHVEFMSQIDEQAIWSAITRINANFPEFFYSN